MMSRVPSHQTKEEAEKAGSTLVGYLPEFFKYAGVGLLIAFAVWVIVRVSGEKTITEKDEFYKIQDPDYIRGLLTTIFAMSTMCIAVILACAGLFKDAPEGGEQALKERFQRGKEILTLLLGIFGTILGFYFGTAYPEAKARGSAKQVVSATVDTPTPHSADSVRVDMGPVTTPRDGGR